MKCTKASLALTTSLAMLSYIQSAEDISPNVWGPLKQKFAPLSIYKSLPDDERQLKITAGLGQIENSLFSAASGGHLPATFKEFYQQVGHLGFSVRIYSPMKGLESPLYSLIRDAHEKGIPQDWLAFAECDGNEYFALNYKDGKVARFTLLPRVQQHENYPTILDWIDKNLNH
ncbi:MAG: SMI1/KNR4 family protein [Alphaproteobacteria bacterium]|nr:SMI1/KNR4 family protein [Alphaproteobacteria bacterium]